MDASVDRRVLVIGDDDADCDGLALRLGAIGHHAEVVRGVAAACARLRARDFAVVVADLPAMNVDALAILRAAHRSWPPARVLLVLPAVRPIAEPLAPLLDEQAFECLRHPLDDESLREHVDAAIEDFRSELARLNAPPRPRPYRGEPPIPRGQRAAWWARLIRSVASFAGRPEEAAGVVVSELAALPCVGGTWIYDWTGDALSAASGGTRGAAGAALALSSARETEAAGRAITRNVAAGGAYIAHAIGRLPRPRGAIVVLVDPPDAFDESDHELLTALAAELGVVARLDESERSYRAMRDGAIDALRTALALRSGHASNSAERVADRSAQIARTLGLDAESAACEEVRLTALLRGVGELAASRGPVTADLARYARLVVEPLPGLERVAESVEACRAHWDGSGMPPGLRREQIPLAARIVAVAYEWEVMSRHRPLPAVAARMQELSAKRFDPDVVAAAVAVMEEEARSGTPEGRAAA